MSEEKSFDLSAEADALIANESEASPEAATEQLSDAGQAEAPAQESQGEQVDPEDILNQLANEQTNPEAEKALLEQINALGAIHNGSPVQVANQKELVELIQKGTDYTKKTMQLAEEKKAFEAESQQKQQEYTQLVQEVEQRQAQIQEHVFENQVMTSIVERLKIDDPELFNHIAQLYQREVGEFQRSQPILEKYNGKLSNLEKEIESLKGQKQSEQLGQIKQGWEKELSEVQSAFGPQLAKLGVKVDWEQVKAAWASDASNSLTVKQAFLAKYAEPILKANESYKKMLETKAKTQQKFISKSGVGSGSHGETKIKAPIGDYRSVLEQALNEIE